MKKLTKVFTAVVALTALIVCQLLQAAPVPYSVYATTGTALGGSALTNYAIIGAYSKIPNGTPVVTYLNAQSLHASSTVQFYSCTNFTYALGATVNVRTNYVGSTNGFGAGTVAVVRHMATDTYERLICSTPQATNIVWASDPATPLAVGDIIYQQTAGGTITCTTNNALGTASINLIGDGIYSGQPGYPLLLDMISTAGTNGVIKAVNATFAP